VGILLVESYVVFYRWRLKKLKNPDVASDPHRWIRMKPPSPAPCSDGICCGGSGKQDRPGFKQPKKKTKGKKGK